MRMTFDELKSKREDFFENCAFIGVDLQNDFGDPKGSLYVKGGEKLVDVANDIVNYFNGNHVFWTKDWHPWNHCSFKDNGGIWPAHCIRHEWGSLLLDGIITFEEDRVIFKGTDINVDSYSAFFDNEKKHSTDLDDTLTERTVTKLLVMGIATDYCVKFTVLDAIHNGYEVYVYLPGCVGVNANPGDVEKAIDEMEDAGAVILEK